MNSKQLAHLRYDIIRKINDVMDAYQKAREKQTINCDIYPPQAADDILDMFRKLMDGKND